MQLSIDLGKLSLPLISLHVGAKGGHVQRLIGLNKEREHGMFRQEAPKR